MRSISLAVMSLALVVAGCSKEPSRTTEAPDVSGSAAGTAGTVKDGLEVLSEGTAPKRLLRYAVPKGTHTPIEMALDVDIDAGIKQNAPTMVIGMDISVDDVTSDGKMTLRSEITGVTARDRPGAISAAMLKGSLDLMTGTKMTAIVGPDGSFHDASLEVGPKTPPAMKEQLSSMTGNLERVAMQLPKVPVGVGAKWRATKQLEQNGMNMTTTTTFEITAIDGDKISYKSTVAVTGPDQTISTGGISAKISSITGGGGGSGTIDLAKLALTGTHEVSFGATMAAGGETTPLKTQMKLVLSPKS